MVLHFYLDLPLTEAADILGIPVGTAKSRLHRGLATLRARCWPTERPECTWPGATGMSSRCRSNGWSPTGWPTRPPARARQVFDDPRHDEPDAAAAALARLHQGASHAGPDAHRRRRADPAARPRCGPRSDRGSRRRRRRRGAAPSSPIPPPMVAWFPRRRGSERNFGEWPDGNRSSDGNSRLAAASATTSPSPATLSCAE